MAKTASKPTNPAPDSTSANTSALASTGKMALKVKSSGPKSAKKPKTAASKRKAAKVDAKQPKKPPTAFFYFLLDFRKEFQEQNPDIKSMRLVGKACGEKWKQMRYEEKVHYYDIATEKRAEFDRATADYNKRKETGEDQGSEDSEYDG
ncbi:hypothetical protein RJ640_020515 [Escallonia rubra]|uniref:HMG box domain-containing protein n=1 Tax=Escallonia rubra TaxID=112253 RepID=A0AA88QSP3_9ASTE|nr:hypothetical protein RJ640_020515 [Escallonia rubra]